jgi:hypothetical protein
MLIDFRPIAEVTYGGIPGRTLFSVLHLTGLVCFAFIVLKRFVPLWKAERDIRFDHPFPRLGMLLQYWLGQWKHPRFPIAGIIHILIFSGFLILVSRALSLLMLGISADFVWPGDGPAGQIYNVLRDYAATIVFVSVLFAALRRLFLKPLRYAVPAQYGKWRPADAILLLLLLAVLMSSDGLFDGSQAAGDFRLGRPVESLSVLSLGWILKNALIALPLPTIWHLHLGAYFTHELTFFFLLCYRPFGIQFHVETSLFSIYFAKLDRGTVKPVRWGVPDA